MDYITNKKKTLSYRGGSVVDREIFRREGKKKEEKGGKIQDEERGRKKEREKTVIFYLSV